MPSLESKVCLVTGGSRGIGRAIALALAREGATVVVAGRNEQQLASVARELGLRGHAVRIDVGDEESVKSGVAEAVRVAGPIDVLVNNAGIATTAVVHKTSTADWNQTLLTNLTGAFWCMREVLPSMIERRFGRIVNVASTAGRTGYRYTGAYCAAKHGLVGLTRSTALEVASKGVTVNALCPGWTETDMLEQAVANIARTTKLSPEDARQALAAKNPMNRLLTPEEVAEVALVLCRPETAGVTGQCWGVDGGEVL